MKKVLLFIFCFFVYFASIAQTWEWAKRQVHYSGNTNACVWPEDVAVDASSNALSCGYYAGEGVDVISFDGILANGFGVGAFHYSGFVAKYNSSGTIQWVQRMGSGPTNGDVQVKSVTSDPSGNVFAAGTFTRTARFGGQLNSDAGGVTKTSVYSSDGFIIKYSSAGVFQWIVTIEADATIQGSKSVNGIKVTDNAIYVVGTYEKKINFGSGITLTSLMDGAWYTNDVFIAKYDLTGTCLWARSAGGSKSDNGNGIIVDQLGNVFVAGNFQSTATFGSVNLTVGSGVGSTNTNSFLAKYNSSGTCQWAIKGNSLTSLWNYHNQIAIDKNNDLYITGFLNAGASIDFGTPVTNPSGSVNSMFVTKITNAGVHSWTRQYTSAGGVTARGISASGNNVYVGGNFTGLGDFGDFDQNSGAWGSAVYILQLDNSNGNVTLSEKAGGSGVTNYDPKLCNDISGNLIAGGLAYSISVPMNFGTNAITLERSTGYVAKMSFCMPSVAPTSATASPSSVCSGVPTNITLSASGGTLGTGAVVQWYTASCGGTYVGTGNPLTISQTLSSNTTYYARYSGDCNTTGCASTTISVDGLPTASAGGTQTICSNGTATVSGTTASNGTILWTENGAGTITAGATTLTPTYTPAAGDEGNTVTLTMTVTSNNACAPQTATATYTVVVVSEPVAPTSGFSNFNNLCVNDAGMVDLHVNGGSGGTVHWFDDACGGNEIGTENPLTINSPDVNTTYFARYESTCGVSDCFSFTVTVVEPPVEPISATSNINNLCADNSDNIILSVVGGSGATLQWFTGSCGGASVGNGNNLSIPSPDVTTTYYARWENTCGNTSCVSHVVTVNPIPTAASSAQSDRNNICANDAGNIDLSVTGGSGEEVHWYTGSCGDTPVGSGNPLTIESPEITTTYYGRWENDCGETVCQNVTVTVLPSANATITPAGPFCVAGNSDVIMAAQIGGTWSGNGINPSNGLFNPGTAGVGDHQITYTIAGTCGDTDEITISVIDLFDATIDAVAPLCSNAMPITLTAATAGGTWSGDGITDANAGIFNATIAGAGDHIITYTYTGLCGNSATTTITVLQKADAAINPAGPFCINGDPVVITAVQIGGVWSGNAINSTTGLFDPEIAGVGDHTITYTISGDCGDSQNIVITVLPLFDATITVVSPMCSADSEITLTAATGGGTWSGTGITDANAGTFDPSVAGAGNHVINYSSSGTCGNSDNIIIVVSPSADASITPVGPFCSDNDPIVIEAAQIGGTWSGTAVNPSNGFFSPKLAGAGNHVITYTISGACGDSDQITISVLDYFDATITTAISQCFADSIVALNANTAGGIWEGDDIVKIEDQYYFLFQNGGIGQHQIIYHLDGLCGDADTVIFNIIGNADATIYPIDTLYIDGEPVIVETASNNGVWSGDYIIENNLFVSANSGIGEFEIIYTIEGQCGDSDTTKVIVLPYPISDLLIPTVITPDADGFNDKWRIQGIEAFNNVSIRIFTRWGDEVFVFDGSGVQYANPTNQWDGRHKDRELPAGSYLYIITMNGNNSFKGTISLIR